MAAPKTKSPTASAELDRQIALLDSRGWDQWDIAAEVGISQPMVSMRLKKIREQFYKNIRRERENALDEKVAQFRDIRKQAWDAWFRSMEDAEKTTEEYGIEREEVGQGDYVTSEVLVKRVMVKEGRLPDNAYLATIVKTLDAERELLGLDEVKPGVVTIEQVLTVLNTIKDAIREVLAEHPALLKVLMQRTAMVLPALTEQKETV